MMTFSLNTWTRWYLSLLSWTRDWKIIKMNLLYQNWIATNSKDRMSIIWKIKGLNWTFHANFECTTHFLCLFQIGPTFNFSLGQQKESNWPSILQSKYLITKKEFGDQNIKKNSLLQSIVDCKRVHSNFTSQLSFL
jgi:hypothetical protein